MPKYWGKQIVSLGRFPEVGQKQKMEKIKKEEDKFTLCSMYSVIFIFISPILLKAAISSTKCFVRISLSNVEGNILNSRTVDDGDRSASSNVSSYVVIQS